MAESEPTPAEATPPPPEAAEPGGSASSGGPSSSALWLAAGVVAAILSAITVTVVKQSFTVSLPPEHSQLMLNDQNMEALAEARAMEREYDALNVGRLTALVAAVLSLVFGVTAGLTHKSLVRGVIGAVVGMVLSALLLFTIGPPAAAMESAAREGVSNNDLYGILGHVMQWAAIGVPVAVAIGVGAGSPVAGGKGILAMLIAAALGGALYVIVGGILAPLETLTEADPKAGAPLYLWSIIPPLVGGLVLARSDV